MDFTALIQELGIDKMTPEEQKPIVDNILATVRNKASLRIAESLTQEQRDHIERIAQEQGDQAALDELVNIFPEYSQVFQDEIDAYKEDLKDMMPR